MNARWPKIVVPLVIVAAGLVVSRVILSGADAAPPAATPPPAPLVRVQLAATTDVRLDVASQGSVAPVNESVISAEVAGRVTWIAPTFEAGGFVSAGEALARLDPRDFALAAVRAESAVAQAERVLATERNEAEIAEQEWREISDEPADPLVLHLPQLAEARAVLAAARADLERAQLDHQRTEIAAPYDGRVLRRDVDIGQFVTTTTSLGRLYAIDRAEVRLPVADADLAWLDLPLRGGDGGPRVDLSVDFAGARWTWEGVIVRTEASIDATTRMLHLVAQVPDPYGGAEGRPPLTPGLFVSASVHGRAARDVVILPRAALRDGGRVWVADNDDALRFRDVVVLRSERERVIVRSGLRPGDRVVVSPIEIATDGMAVRVDPEAAPPATAAKERP